MSQTSALFQGTLLVKDHEARADVGALRTSTAPLGKLPVRLEIPEQLRERITYDENRHQLIFRGYMSSADYFFLRICCDDPEFQYALNELHAKSAWEVHCRPRLVPRWLWALVAASFVLAGMVWLFWIFGS